MRVGWWVCHVEISRRVITATYSLFGIRHQWIDCRGGGRGRSARSRAPAGRTRKQQQMDNVTAYYHHGRMDDKTHGFLVFFPFLPVYHLCSVILVVFRAPTFFFFSLFVCIAQYQSPGHSYAPSARHTSLCDVNPPRPSRNIR